MKAVRISFFDEANRMEYISKLGDPLEKLNEAIDWEIFRSVLTEKCRKEDTGKGGRPGYDVVMMFKIIILQRLYNLSDDQMEYQINDRMSFMKFLGLSLSEKVPDAKTIWKFKDTLAQKEVMEELFEIFDEKLEAEGLITQTGTIVDATIVDVPKQRNTRKENKEIKEGRIPEEWKTAENASKLAQKDTDARWVKKNNETHYGYKNHVKCDAESKLITGYGVSDAALHDSQMCTELLDENDQCLYADSAYSGKEIAENLPKNCRNEICEKGYRDYPLTEEQKENNRRKSKIRCRIEHIFGSIENDLKGIAIRSIGFTRARFNIGLMNLTYNMRRYVFFKNAPI